MRRPVPHVLPIRPSGSKVPLFCCAPASGVGFPLYHLATHLDNERPFYVVQDRSLNSGVPVYPTVGELAKDQIRAIREILPDGPYHIAGWSFGGAVAYEIARQLAESGNQVGLVGLIDVTSSFDISTEQSEKVSKAYFVLHFGGIVVRVASMVGPYLRDGIFMILLNSENGGGIRGKLASALRKCRPFVNAPVVEFLESNPHLVNTPTPTLYNCMRVLISNMRVLSRFKPEPFPGRLTVIHAGDNSDIGLPEFPRDMGWSPFAGDGVDIVELPCNHIRIMMPPYIEQFGRTLSEKLDQADQRLIIPSTIG